MEQNQDSSLFGMNVDQTGKAHLSEAARWAKFLAIIGFIGCGLIALLGIFFGSFMSMFTGQLGGNPYNDMPTSAVSGIGAMAAVFYIIIALIYFFPCLFLFRFATKMKTAIASNDQETLNVSFQNLKACFRFIGIVTLVLLCFWVLAFIIGLLGAATAGI